MNWRKLLIAVACIAVAAIFVIWAQWKIQQLQDERDRYKNNTETLLTEVEQYKTRDSLSAARVQSLELTVKEYERFRADDAALIKSLKLRNRDLSEVNTAQAQTIIELSARPRDTVVVTDSIPIPAVAVHCGDAWFDFDGILTEKEFTGKLQSRDSLMLVETVKYKRRCWLFKTKKIVDRQLDVISKNPYTTIMGVEHVVISK